MAYTAFAIALVVMSSWTFVANFCTFLAVSRKWLGNDHRFKPMCAVDKIIFNLTICDTLFGVANLITFTLGGGDLRTSTYAICATNSALLSMLGVASLEFVFLLGFVRWRIVSTKNMNFSGTLTSKMLTAAWLTAWICGALSLIPGVAKPSPSGLACQSDPRPIDLMTTIKVIAQIASCTIPSLGLLVVYAKIYVVLKSYPEEVLRTATSKDGGLILAFSVTILYVLTISPFIGGLVHQFIEDRLLSPTDDAILTLIALVNFTLNPVFYAYFQKKYRQAMWDLFFPRSRKKLTTKGVTTKFTLTTPMEASHDKVNCPSTPSPLLELEDLDLTRSVTAVDQLQDDDFMISRDLLHATPHHARDGLLNGSVSADDRRVHTGSVNEGTCTDAGGSHSGSGSSRSTTRTNFGQEEDSASADSCGAFYDILEPEQRTDTSVTLVEQGSADESCGGNPKPRTT